MPTCNPNEIPPVAADFCQPVTNFGQVSRIHMGNAGNPFSDWTSLTEWNARLDNVTINDLTKIRTFHTIGSKPKPERSELKFSQNRKIYTASKHSIPFKVDETDDANYAFMQFLEENPAMTIPVWWEVGKYIYGGNSGVQATVVFDEVTPESDEELQVFEGVIEWTAKAPDRILNPLA